MIGRGLAGEVDDPVERRIAAAENGELLAVVLRGVAHAVVNGPAFEYFRARHAEPARLERADATGDDHGARVEARAEDGLDVESAVLAPVQRGDFLAQVQRRIERHDLLQQPIDEFLGAADGQRRNVVDRLVGIQLGALAARRAERIDDMAAHAQQAELEHLEQPAGAGANDHDFGDDGRLRGNLGQSQFLRWVWWTSLRGAIITAAPERDGPLLQTPATGI